MIGERDPPAPRRRSRVGGLEAADDPSSVRSASPERSTAHDDLTSRRVAVERVEQVASPSMTWSVTSTTFEIGRIPAAFRRAGARSETAGYRRRWKSRPM